jgi:PTS system fructose-specific IIC component
MGLSFITEGAIPFASADPLHVIPSQMVGSAIAGALSMVFGCALRAPHGGIFVLPLVEKPLLYMVALLVGVAVTTVLVMSFKKDLPEEELENKDISLGEF